MSASVPWFESYAESIGGTPLVRLRRVVDGAHGRVFAKVESQNPASSAIEGARRLTREEGMFDGVREQELAS